MANTRQLDQHKAQVPLRAAIARLARRPRWVAIGVAVLGLIVTMAVWKLLVAFERELADERFDKVASHRVAVIQREFNATLGGLHLLRAYYDGSDSVTRREFDVFTQSFRGRRSGFQAMGWAPLIAGIDRSSHEKSTREEGYGNYQISAQGAEGNLVSVGERGEYCPVHFLVSEHDDLLALGLDLLGDERFGQVVERCRDTGEIVVSQPLELVREVGTEREVVVFSPVYRNELPINSAEQRRESFQGVCLGVFSVGTVVAEALKDLAPNETDIYLFDPSLPPIDRLICASVSLERRESSEPLQRSLEFLPELLIYKRQLEVADQRWTAYCIASDEYRSFWQNRRILALGAVAVGVVITALLAGYLILLGQQATRTESLVAQRTAELRESEQRFRRAILEAPFPMMLHAEGGEVLLLSHAWTELTGYTRDQLPTVFDWQRKVGGVSARWPEEDLSGLFRVGRRKDEGEHTIITNRTEQRTWHFSSAPLGRLPDGRRLAIVMAADVTDRKRYEKRLLEAHEVLETRVQERTAELRAINLIFQQALTSDNSQEVGRSSLEVAEKLTGSAFGFIGEVNDAGRCDILAISDSGWEMCRMPESDALRLIRDMEVRGIWGAVFKTGRSVMANDPASHPDRVGTPEGHPTLTCFLGAPLKHGGKTIGIIGLANKPGGYKANDQRAVETLALSFVEALMRKRAEEALRQAHEELEMRVEQRTAELARSNAELEQFAYAASHDLQEPLRMIASYVQLLAERYRGQLDEDADEFIEYAVDGARRMQQLIEDLLAYSRVGTRGKPFKATDCGRVVDEVIHNLRMLIREHDARISCHTLPVLQADRTQLVQLFQNLVANAIKFRGEESPHVDISAEKSGDEWVFCVSDNGIGIDPKYQDRVFAIFQRLHTRREYAGTGIGLAICRRIVDRHGGRIWYESEPGQGTTFRFTLLASGGGRDEAFGRETD